MDLTFTKTCINIHVHWASKETYNFLEWCPLKSTASKWMIFGIMLATVLITHARQKTRNRNCRNEINAFKSQQVLFLKSQKMLPFHRTDFGHFNSYSFEFNSTSTVHNRFTDPAIEFEWIAIEMSESVRWKWSSFCEFWNGLVVIWRHLSHFWHFRFHCFLTWVMRRTVANTNLKFINFDAVDFSGHHSKKL